MNIELIKNSTLKINYDDKIIKLDSKILEKDTTNPLMDSFKSTAVDLTKAVEEMIKKMNSVFIAHSSFVDFNDSPERILPKGIQLLPNSNPQDFSIKQHFNNAAMIKNVMLESFHLNLSMDEYAKLCGKSLSTFKRDFKKYFKNTPSKWLKTKRLEYAKTLLLNSDLNINEVCFESGFVNSSHFILTFKSVF